MEWYRSEARWPRRKTHQIPADQRDKFMDRFAIAVVRGPGGRLHVIDHHHRSRAWIELGVEKAPVRVKADFSGLDYSTFLRKLIDRGWIHPYNE
ncbi:ParB-like protein [Paraburkholderia hospita]|uniref:ParB-like protein n=1 Tax=Paraburkholderia hospita TaxID=169430 RepID=UPI003F502F71